MTALNAYAIALSIFRNREWVQQFYLQNADGSPLQTVGDVFSLVVLSGSRVALSSVSPVLDSTLGTVTFTSSDTETGKLIASTTTAGYVWQFIRIANGKINSDLLAAGPLNVGESPPFPPHV